MKKGTNILLIALIAACLAGLFGYRMLDRLRTDNQAPEIVMETDMLELSVTQPREALLQGVTAMDKKDGDVTDLLVVEKVSLINSDGDIQVSYAAFDRSGNVSKDQRQARYTDYVSPRFYLQSALRYRYGISFDVLTNIGAQDILDGDIQHRIKASSLDNASISEMGVHNIQFQVTNSLGDTVSYVLPVEVYDATQYDAELNLTTYLVYLNRGDNFNPRDYLDEFVLRNETTNLRNGLPRDYTLETKGAVQTDTPGAYAVDYLVTYTVRNENDRTKDQYFTGCSKLIVIVEG